MKYAWWMLFFGALLGLLLLAPESNFSIRIIDLSKTLNYAFVDVISVASEQSPQLSQYLAYFLFLNIAYLLLISVTYSSSYSYWEFFGFIAKFSIDIYSVYVGILNQIEEYAYINRSLIAIFIGTLFINLISSRFNIDDKFFYRTGAEIIIALNVLLAGLAFGQLAAEGYL